MRHAFFISLILSISFFLTLTAQGATASNSRITYDVSGSQTTVNDRLYQEVNLGLNWYFTDWFMWRNSAFSRSAQEQKTIYGLDSSFRLQHEWLNSSKTLGFKIFGGPGARLASEKYNAYFGEAGIGFRLGGIQLSGGVRSYKYTQSRTDSDGVTLPKNENHVFVTISGGGVL